MNLLPEDLNGITLKQCNNIKVILALLVMLYHCCAFWGGYWFTKDPVIDAPEIVAFASWLDSFNVYTFAMISGYLFYFLKMENQHYPTFKKFIQSKLHRLILPAYSVSFLWVIPLSLLFYSMSCTTIFKKYFLMNGPSQLWFLVMLFDVFILGWVVRYFVQKSNIGSILLGGCSFAIAVLGLHYNLNYFMIFTGFMYFPVFCLALKYVSINLYYCIRSPL